jgi:hypothetical protein
MIELFKTNMVSVLKNPFESDKIERIYLFMNKGFSGCYWSGGIQFKNGNSEGEQKFRVDGAENIHIILNQMDEFIKSLK